MKKETRDAEVLVYRRSRFRTRLPRNRAYTRAHYWLRETGRGVWRAGFTKFATRMLGDIVEYEFETEQGAEVALGRRIGWIEGFKAVSEIYAVAEGRFHGGNPRLREDITLLESDPYEEGWLYEIGGRPEADRLDADNYALALDAIIDKMLASRYEGAGDREPETGHD